MYGKQRWQFFNIKIPSQKGHSDILKILIWPQWREWTCHFATKKEPWPEWRSDRIGDRLWYGFDWEQIRAEKNRPWWRSDRIVDLTRRWVSTVCVSYPKPHYEQVLKSQQLHIYLSDIYELIIQNPLPWPLLGRWVAKKLTVLLRGMSKLVDLKLVLTPSEHKTFVWLYTMLDQRRRCWADVV